MDTRQEKFARFHAENPHIYAELLSRTRSVQAAGRKRFGIRTIWEAMRWDAATQPNSRDDWKLNDWYPPFYARLLAKEPGLDGFFELRSRNEL